MRADLFHRAFRWVADRAEHFRLLPGSGRERVIGVKRLAELATLAAATLPLEPEAAPLLAFAWSEATRGAAIAEAVELQPAIAIAYLPFFRAGLRSAELEASLARLALHAGHARWTALTRYSVGFLLDAIGVTPPWCIATALLELHLLTPANRWPYPLQVAMLAHVVMWQTAMGHHPNGLHARDREALHAFAAPCAARLIHEGHLDPLAELVIANDCIDGAPLVTAWQHLVAAQRADGSVPPARGATSAQFDDTYHATLVAALAAARTS